MAQALTAQAEAFGFNQQIPLDVPADTVAASNFGTVASFDPPTTPACRPMNRPSARRTSPPSALQMAMVAGTVADGGIEMTPHLMEQIRDSQGNLVEPTSPSRGCTPISPADRRHR